MTTPIIPPEEGTHVHEGEIRFVNFDPPPIHVALANVARRVSAVGKTGQVDPKMGGYKFRKYDDIVDAIHDAMAEEGIIPMWCHLSEPRHEQWSDKMHRYVAHVQFRFIGPAGDSLETIAWCEALDNGDKGLGKAISYGLKDLLTRMLTLPFNDASVDTETTIPDPAHYEDGYERTYDANTVDPPVEPLISDEEREAVQKKIADLTDEQREVLKERWKKLTEAKALRPLQRMRPSDLPVFDDLIKNIAAAEPPCDTDADTAADTPRPEIGEAPAQSPDSPDTSPDTPAVMECGREDGCDKVEACSAAGACTEPF